MNNSGTTRPTSTHGLLDLSHLEPYIVSHLRRVYACMSVGLLCAIAGAVIALHDAQPTNGLFAALFSIGLVLYLYSSWGDVSPERHAAFAAFCVVTGSSLASLIGVAIDIDPSILISAILVTLVVTVCFSVASLLAKTNRWMMYMAGPLASALTLLILLSLYNMITQLELMFTLLDSLALVVSSCGIIYHTQIIVESTRYGEDDYISHCLILLIDAAIMFYSVLTLQFRFRSVGIRSAQPTRIRAKRSSSMN